MAGDQATAIKTIIKQFDGDRSQLMNIARAIQAQLGYLSEETIGCIAEELGIPRAEVRDMVSFYSFLSREPLGKHTIRLCNAVVERMHGADLVLEAFESALDIGPGETTEDGIFSLETTACIGLSDQAPGALIDGTPLTNLEPADVPKLLDALRAGKDVSTLPEAEVDSNIRQTGDVIFSPMTRGAAVRASVNKTPLEVINELNISRLRGRGGAGFPTAMKWDFCRKAEGDHYVVCNGDEGEPGTFKDRAILMEQPDLLFEGMTVAGYALGAKEGLLYLRAEYEFLLPNLEQVLAKRRHLSLLGNNICGMESFDFDIRIQLGAGAYICGEESALIESLEGKRGAPRDRPPFPVEKGYKNQPTAVNNIETLCCVARILEKGGEWFSKLGTRDSTGTKLLSISGDCKQPGVYELPYGITIRSLLELIGAEEAQAVQVGGPSGKCIAPKDFARSITFEDLPTGGSIIIFGPDRNLLECMHQFLEFFVEESCGWCAPCRVGSTLLLKKMEQVLSGNAGLADLEAMRKIGLTMKTTSRCGLGQTAANPVLTTINDFAALYAEKVQPVDYVPSIDLEAAIAVGCAATGREAELTA